MWLVLATVVAVMGTGIWGGMSLWSSPAGGEFVTCVAREGEFVYELTERGELESSANLEIRCEVESKDGKGMKILEIVPEGTVVQEGAFLIRFDDSGLRNERTLQEIALNNAQAAATQAKNDVESAEFAKKEYELGTYRQEEEKLESELFVARENLRRGQDLLEHTKRLASRGYVNQAATEAEVFAVAKCKKELGVAETKLRVLREYSKEKTLRKHDADIGTARAKLRSEEAKLELEQEKLKNIDAQILKCVVKAPRAGQVIYNHDQDDWGGADHVIKEGTVVYERRVVLRMPDLTRMQVKARIAESKIDRLEPGQPAVMEIEGLPGVTLRGQVTKVNDFPAQGSWFRGSVKEFETTVVVDSPPEGLRPGMTAKVAIVVERLPLALQVPMQAVAEVNGTHYCLQRRPNGRWEPRPVKLGTSNEKFLVIHDGVTAGDELLLSPRDRLVEWDSLPKLVESSPARSPSPEPSAAPATGRELSQARN